MTSQNRFVSIAEYQRLSGLSYPTVKAALEAGELFGVRTSSGHWRIQVMGDRNADVSFLLDRLEKSERLLRLLCSHLGVSSDA